MRVTSPSSSTTRTLPNSPPDHRRPTCRGAKLALRETGRVRPYGFYGRTEEGATALAGALREDGMRTDSVAPGKGELPGWVVVANGEDRSQGLLEMLARLYGGSY